MKHTTFLVLSLVFAFCSAYGQLKPGFDKDEYKTLLSVTSQFSNDTSELHLPVPAGCTLVYRSPVLGLDNRWDLWRAADGTPIISIRGTTQKQISWMENFYAAMVPAKGELKISQTEKFDYQLAESPKAAVHIGWLIGTAFLSKDILPKIDSCFKKGAHDFYIVGHSQGGAISYLLTAYLHGLQRKNLLPPSIRFKTYCSAAPKPGNLYFAYDYEAMTQDGWAYNVVNAADWVPETPFTVQTVDDFANVNPFINVKPVLNKTKWPKRWALSHVYNSLNRPSKKARKRYQKYLGSYVAKTIRKALPGFEEPKYFNSSDYVRAGNIIALVPKEDYYRLFPEDKTKLFRNHLPKAYLYLVDQLQ